MDVLLAQDEVVKSLWSEYKKTAEYSSGLIKAIPEHHPIVEKHEKLGLKTIYASFIKKLSSTVNAKDELKDRSISDWLNEWKKMHKMLFNHILKDCENWRKTDVRFGKAEYFDEYKVPPPSQEVPRQIGILAEDILASIKFEYADNDQKYNFLARIHYEFIRIHPFADGNGRIARALTDQLSIFLGLPPAMGGYPRHSEKKRDNYHKAIQRCIEEKDHGELALWIGGYIENQLKQLA